MHAIRKNGATSNVLRATLRSSSTGGGLAGLTPSSSGLIVSAIADNEATAVAYTAAASTIETIATLGTYAAPTATKCRFKEVDATNHPGLYEIQLADARYAVAGAKVLRVAVSGAAGLLAKDVVVQLSAADLDDGVRLGLTALPGAAAAAAGGLFTRGTGAGQINQDANGRIDVNLVASLTRPVTNADGTAQATGNTTTAIKLASGSSATTDFYKGNYVRIVFGTGAGGPGRIVTAYDGSTKIATVTPAWPVAPDSTSEYVFEGDDQQTGDAFAVVNSGAFGNSVLNTNLGTLLARLSATRAGYLDNVNNANLLAVPSSPAAVGSAMTLTSGERDAVAAALLDLANGVESGKTLRQAVRLIAAAVAGKRSNSGTTAEQFDAIGNPGTARVVGNLTSGGDGTPTLSP
jgi:hypothetical protein